MSFDSLTDAQRAMLRVPIVNDLTTGGTDKALSAEQGKVLFIYADDGKKSIADAIIGKGGSATKDDTFKDLAAKIAGIKTGYGVGDVIPEENVKALKKLVGAPEKIWEFAGHTGTVYALSAGPDGSIYSGGDDKKVFKISSEGKKSGNSRGIQAPYLPYLSARTDRFIVGVTTTRSLKYPPGVKKSGDLLGLAIGFGLLQ